MAISTIYDVKLQYDVKDLASNKIKSMGMQAAKTSKSFGFLRGAVVAAAGAFGLKKMIDSTIGLNIQLENTQAQLRSLLQINLGGSFAENAKRATTLLAQFRKDAKTTPGTFRDMADFSSRIAGNITRAGGSMEDLRQITKGGVIAANLFGEEAGLAARDIQQALAGTLGAKDRFAKAIIEPFLKTQGVSKDFLKTWNEIVKKKPGDAIKLLGQVFNQKAIKDASKGFKTSFAGVSSTLKSNLQEVGERIGKPVFEAIKTTFIEINNFFDKNQTKIKNFANSVGQKLLTAFKIAKSVFKTLARHRTLLMTMAKAFISFKGAKALAGPFLTLANVAGTAAGGLGKFSGKLPGLIGLVAGLAVSIASIVDKNQEASIAAKQSTANFLKNVKDAEIARKVGVTSRLAEQAKAAGRGTSTREVQSSIAFNLVSEATARGILPKVDRPLTAKDINEQVLSRVAGTDKFFAGGEAKETRASIRKELGRAITQFSFEIAAKQQRIRENTRARGISAVPGKSIDAATNQAPQVNVGKIDISVESNDPDKFAIGVQSLFQDLLANGVQAATTQFEGGAK